MSMLKTLSVIIIMCIIGFSLDVMAESVNIPDESLRKLIEDALGKSTDEPITDTDMLTLTELKAKPGDISDLSGIQYATNLTELNLRLNNVSDLSKLASLTGLTVLVLDRNDIQESIEIHIPAIETNGARVDFDTPTLREDVNKDGIVNILDLVFVASQFGHACPNEADINDDGVINIQDLVLVAQAFGNTTEE